MATLADDILYAGNVSKIDELDPEVRWRFKCWLDRCWMLKRKFRILEAYRTKERQAYLYAQGRTRPGQKVTWTKDSYHCQGKAIDFLPIGCTYDAVAAIAEPLGLVRPYALIQLGDIGHIQASEDWVAPIIPSPPKNDPRAISARIRRLEEQLKNEHDVLESQKLKRQIERLKGKL